MKIIASRNGGPMNPFFQEYNISRIAIARNDDHWMNEDLDVDPHLRLMENYNRNLNFKNFL